MKEILFVCQGNSIRSIIAEAVFNKIRPSGYTAKSAGTTPIANIDSNAMAVLGEINISPSKSKPSSITFEEADKAEKIIMMKKDLPNFPEMIPKEKIIVWDIKDTVGKDIEAFRETRDQIVEKVKALIEELK